MDNKDYSQMLTKVQLEKLFRNNWKLMLEDEKQKLAQNIVNLILHDNGINLSVRVIFVEFDDDGIRGLYDRNIQQLQLNKHLFVDNYKLYNNKKEPTLDSNTLFYHTIMHELKHVEQAWLMQHPELDPERAEKLIINNLSNKKNNMYIMQSNLYKLQIAEREAFEFEIKQQKFLLNNIELQFNKSDKYSNLIFKDFELPHYILSKNFKEEIFKAKKSYQTNTPEQDLDNIMDAIANNKPYDKLNQTMLKEVLELTKIRSRFFPFFAQEQLLVEDNEKLSKTELDTTEEEPELKYNDWFDDR